MVDAHSTSRSGSSHDFPPRQWVQTNGIAMAFHERGEGPVVLLLHGFPEISFSWRHQFGPLASAGWRVIAPDLRGYGATGCHGNLAAYSLANLANDIIGLMDRLGIAESVVVGHDFGGALAWTLARDYPLRIRGIASLNTPYTHRGREDLVSVMKRVRGPDNYMVRFQEPGLGEALLEQNIEVMFGRLMRRPALSLGDFYQKADVRLRALPMTLFTGEPAVMGEPFLSSEELVVFVEAFRQTGFTGALSWYRNHHRNWMDTAGTTDRVCVPALMISAADDYFLPPDTTLGMESYVVDLERHIIAACGHWTQQEKPLEVNHLLLDWLQRRMG